MTTPASPKKTFRLEDFPFHTIDKVRFADLDPLNHVNNAVYSSYFESGRIALMHDPDHGLLAPGLSWVLARIAIDFVSEVHFPGDATIGVGVSRIGRTSVTFQQAVFSRGVCSAVAESVGVITDNASRKPTPLPDNLLANLQRWIMPALKG